MVITISMIQSIFIEHFCVIIKSVLCICLSKFLRTTVCEKQNFNFDFTDEEIEPKFCIINLKLYAN